jgi:hypothetical protein
MYVTFSEESNHVMQEAYQSKPVSYDSCDATLQACNVLLKYLLCHLGIKVSKVTIR